jgi:uncharacterized cupredoxin-like copper-binding protein
MIKFNTRRVVAAALLVLTTTSAFAHGNEEHRKAHNAEVIKEQQPWGIAGVAREARRTIRIAMTDDMRFTPSTIQVREGETVRFIVQNKGKVMHEMVIGTKPALDEHAALMQKFPNMEHDEAHMAHVATGKQGELVWKFNRAGEFDFACLIPGHYQAGMVGKINVVAAKEASR